MPASNQSERENVKPVHDLCLNKINPIENFKVHICEP